MSKHFPILIVIIVILVTDMNGAKAGSYYVSDAGDDLKRWHGRESCVENYR